MSAERFHLHAFWDEALPNHFAAGIQILRTGAAFAVRGHRFTCHCRALADEEAKVLAHYGAAAEGMTFALFAAPVAGAGPVARWRLRRRLMRRIPARTGKTRHAILLRGASALRMAGALADLARLEPARRPLLLLEMHNLQYLRDAEKRLGRALDPARLDDPRSRALKAAEIRLVSAVDGLICLTEPVREAATPLVPLLPPSLLLPSGTDLPERAAAPVRRYDIVYAGKIEPRKGVSDLIAAMRHLPGRTLVLAGGPADAVRELAEAAAASGVLGQVSFAGLLPPSEVDEFLRAGRIGVCPLPRGRDSVSDRFTSPMKLLQMMALGLPVVATDVPPVRAIVSDCVDGLLVAPNDPPALAEAIGRLLADPALSARLGAAARARVGDFSWQRRAEKLEGFLRLLEPAEGAHLATPDALPANRAGAAPSTSPALRGRALGLGNAPGPGDLARQDWGG